MPPTPSPWTVQHDTRSGDNGIFAEGTGCFAETYADIRFPGEDAREEAAANARLIAAAPDLLAALSGIKWKSADRDNFEFTARITYSQMDGIRAALAKAEGK